MLRGRHSKTIAIVVSLLGSFATTCGGRVTSPTDASVDTSAENVCRVSCGAGVYCQIDMGCCAVTSSLYCTSQGSCNKYDYYDRYYECDKRCDCPADQVCCGYFGYELTGSKCAPGCNTLPRANNTSWTQLCASSDECPQGQMCALFGDHVGSCK